MNDVNQHQTCYQAWSLCLLRLILGTIFIAHGSQKVFGLFGGPGLEQFVAWTTSLGVPPLLGYLAAFAEFGGGVFMFFGIATELGALLTIPVMIGAVFLVHWEHGYFIQHGGFEYPFNLILFALAIIIGGPGMGAIWDPFIKIRKCK